MVSERRFAVLILSHGRADSVKTYDMLRGQGYTGEIYIVIDDEDDQIDEYKKRYGDHVIVFNKLAASQITDTADPSDDRRIVVFARNQCHRIARGLGLDYFLELDDDYYRLVFKFTEDLRYTEKPIKNLDAVFEHMVDYLASIDATTVAFMQNGDFIGGRNNTFLSAIRIKRKAMNSFFCKTNKPFEFFGRVNEDANMYALLGYRGRLIFSIPSVSVLQYDTQSRGGGLTDVYLEEGTYRKSFYTVMFCPSFVKIFMMGDKHRRLHHKIKWSHAVPRILEERWRKDPLTTLHNGYDQA